LLAQSNLITFYLWFLKEEIVFVVKVTQNWRNWSSDAV